MSEICVIIPVYNTEQYLHRCLESVLAQTFEDFELILIDDGSTDASGIICDEYAKSDSRVRVFHQTNKGQSAARNFALDWMFENSDSEYVSFVDSDDWVHPQYLELLREGIKQYDVNISQCLFLKTHGIEEIPAVENRIVTITPEEQYTDWYCSFMHCKLYRRSVWAKIRMPEGRIYEDVAIWYKIVFCESKIALVKEYLYYYYYNMESSSRSDWTKAMLIQINTYEEIEKFFLDTQKISVLNNYILREMDNLNWHFRAIKKSTKLSSFEKVKYRTIIRLKMKILFMKYYKYPAFSSKKDYYWFVVSPLSHKCYWFCVNILSKIKHFLCKKL